MVKAEKCTHRQPRGNRDVVKNQPRGSQEAARRQPGGGQEAFRAWSGGGRRWPGVARRRPAICVRFGRSMSSKVDENDGMVVKNSGLGIHQQHPRRLRKWCHQVLLRASYPCARGQDDGTSRDIINIHTATGPKTGCDRHIFKGTHISWKI